MAESHTALLNHLIHLVEELRTTQDTASKELAVLQERVEGVGRQVGGDGFRGSLQAQIVSLEKQVQQIDDRLCAIETNVAGHIGESTAMRRARTSAYIGAAVTFGAIVFKFVLEFVRELSEAL